MLWGPRGLQHEELKTCRYQEMMRCQRFAPVTVNAPYVAQPSLRYQKEVDLTEICMVELTMRLGPDVVASDLRTNVFI